MLGIQLPNMIKGKIHLECTGPITLLLNQAHDAGILVENIYWVDEHKVQLTILLPDFFRFAKMVRALPIRMRIMKKEGFPFIIERIKKRKSLYVGVILFFALLFAMSLFVWKVQIEGIERIPEAHIKSLLIKDGIYEGQLKMRLPEREEVQHRLLQQLPQASWVGFRVEGTRVVITVVEKKLTESEQPKFPSFGPVHLISKKNALVTDMQVEQGNPVVEVNDMVKKGQLLVSGKYGDPHQPDTGTVVGARGKVMGEVWYESEIAVPLHQKRKVYTGYREQETVPYVGTWVIRNPLGKEMSYKQFETVQRLQPIRLGKWELPLGLLNEERLEMEWVNQKLTLQEAVQLGKERAKEELAQWIGADGKITEEKVLHQSVENGKVYLKVHFDAIENIAVPQPILQGE